MSVRVVSVLIPEVSVVLFVVPVESAGLDVAGEGVSQAIKPRQATVARKNNFFINLFLVF